MIRIRFIVNPVSGSGHQYKIPSLIDKFLDHNKFEHRIVHTEGKGHATELCKGFAADGVGICQ